MERDSFSLPTAAGLLGAILLVSQPTWAADKAKSGNDLTKEFCQACHFFEGSDQAGTLGPPFVGMKARFPDRKRLHVLIYDLRYAMKPHSIMPPFGKNGLLTDAQIENIIDYLYTL